MIDSWYFVKHGSIFALLFFFLVHIIHICFIQAIESDHVFFWYFFSFLMRVLCKLWPGFYRATFPLLLSVTNTPCVPINCTDIYNIVSISGLIYFFFMRTYSQKNTTWVRSRRYLVNSILVLRISECV